MSYEDRIRKRIEDRRKEMQYVKVAYIGMAIFGWIAAALLIATVIIYLLG